MWFKKSYDIKSENEWITREQIGFFLFTRANLLETRYKNIIIEMINDFLKVIVPEQFDKLRNGPDANYFKLNTKINFVKFKKDFLKFKYEYNPDKDIDNTGYEIDFKKGGGNKNTIGDFRFYINIDGSINYNEYIVKTKRYCHEIAIFVPKDFIGIERLINFIKKFYTSLKCCYGYINPVISYNKAEFGKISNILEHYTKGEPDIFDIPDNLSNSEYLETKIKGVHWGNLISQKHIEQLDGKERIENELKNFTIEELPQNSLFIKMPLNIPDKKNNDIIKYYKMLAKIFEPIFIPRWNQSDIGLKVGLHRTGDKFLRRFL